MAASIFLKRLLQLRLRSRPLTSRISHHLSCTQQNNIHTSALSQKDVACRVKVGKGDKPVTYEQANFPYTIAVTKGWNSHHTGNLKDELFNAAGGRVLEDFFVRKFIQGTFHQCLATDLIFKRRGNKFIIVAMMLRRIPPQKFYFLIAYTEEMLSHWFKFPVKMEVQILDERPIYKWL